MNVPRPPEAEESASLRQLAAVNPRDSTWLLANAGSGKTRVLIDRVARLLLAGTDPTHVLCLTYTRAAAAEMQDRLFGRLGAWALLPEPRLFEELRAIGLTAGLEPLDLAAARRLFAQAIETPGGLRIQTIHAFCGGLLRRFPLEAGVSPQFRELDDREAERLAAAALEEMATGPEAPLLDALAARVTEERLGPLIRDLAARRDAVLPPRSDAELRRALGLAPEADAAATLACLAAPGRRELLAEIAALCADPKGGAGDAEAAAALAEIAARPAPTPDCLLRLEELLLHGPSASRNTPFTARIDGFPGAALRRQAAPGLLERLHGLMRDVEAARELRLALAAHDRHLALHAFGAAFHRALEAQKARGGWLGFDDLIAGALRLLTDPAVAQWVLYRLDGGIDHILVDEAQDTSPAQWAVIERLAAEFPAAGDGRDRTLFVVGDRKQSIYSFQGADVAAFEAVRARLGRGLAKGGRALHSRELLHSFRSAPAVLQAVDATFRGAAAGLGGEPRHEVLRREMPGRVDLWPALGEEDKDEPPPWHSPADRPAPRRAQARCARLVAERVAALIASERLPMALADGGWGSRPVGPGDVLILVQRRDRLFDAIIRELKGQGLDVAGADRLRLRAELAVRDLEAVLRVLALPEDDLSLAAALRSPLFDWSERDLYALAQPRPEGQTLWQALCAAPRQGPVARALDILEDLRDQVEFLRPFELADRLLLRHRGRERLLARLGPEAEDALDAFLAQTLAYEAAEVPSLTGFLEWRDRGEAEVKRRPDAAGRRIRVMTVHGAKGLEAPIVILPDSALRARAPARAPLIATEAGLLWTCPKGERPRAIAAAEAQREALEAEERRRLLYVAMTRAEAWLIVCAAGKVETKGEGGEECWHAAVRRGLQALGARAHDFGEGLGEGLRHEPDGWQRAPVAQPAAPGHAPPQPEVPDGSPPPPPARPAALTPSGLGGAKTLPGEADPGDATALARGRLLHLALEHLPALPPEGRGADLLALLEAAEDAPAAGGREVLADLVLQAETLVAAPHLAPLWAPATLAEVVLAAELPRLGRLRGAVDRLIVAPDAVTAVDFKTNRLVPARPEEVPEGLLRQMGAYVAMLRAVYPDREARAAILWTRGARLMELPGDLLAAALSRATPAVA